MNGPYNKGQIAPLRNHLRAIGAPTLVGGWEARPHIGTGVQHAQQVELDFYIAEWEVWPQDRGLGLVPTAISVIDNLPWHIPCSLATNYNPFDAGGKVAAVCRDHKMPILGEVYKPENPPITVGAQKHQGLNVVGVGHEDWQPVIGVYEHHNSGMHHYSVEEYAIELQGETAFWIWLPNYMYEADWAKAALLS